MKKGLFIAIMFVLSFSLSFGQEIGVRFGEVTGGNVAVDAVFSMGSWSRIHADVSFGSYGVSVDALWDFINQPLGGEAFNWYAGVGPFVGLGDPFFLGVVGEIGLEYHFNGVPIAVGLDWRPAFTLVETTDFTAKGFGLNVRYVIN